MSTSVYTELTETLTHFTGIALQPLFNNWIQWNNSTLQRQHRYWQPNLRTVASMRSEFPNALCINVCTEN
jgi:phage baseplate assembly protein gpV